MEPLLGPRPRIVLELGAGTGDFTVGLAPLVDSLVAVEPSPPMLERGRQRLGTAGAHVEWREVAAEEHAFDRRYSAVVAAEAFHWLDWHRVMPRIGESLAPGGHLVLIARALAEPPPWEPDLRTLIRHYSTNRDYVPYDVVTELASRGLIIVEGRAQTEAVAYGQTVDDYIESFHSRNGFSRARLAGGRAQKFDDTVKTLLGRHCPDGMVWLPVQARITWSRPRAGA